MRVRMRIACCCQLQVRAAGASGISTDVACQKGGRSQSDALRVTLVLFSSLYYLLIQAKQSEFAIIRNAESDGALFIVIIFMVVDIVAGRFIVHLAEPLLDVVRY